MSVGIGIEQIIRRQPERRTEVCLIRVTDRQVQAILTSLESRTDIYRRDMTIALDRSILNNTRSETSAISYITEFENATDRLKQNFDARRSTTNDVNEVLTRAGYIDSFMRDYRFDTRAEQRLEFDQNRSQYAFKLLHGFVELGSSV